MRLRSRIKQLIIRTPLPEWILHYRSRRHLVILASHRICAPLPRDYPFDDDLVSATPEAFEHQLDYLRSRLDFVSLEEFLEGLKDPGSLPPRPALLTFDDGYLDSFEVALPLLRSRGLSGCFFLCTGLVGTRLIPWWDRVACCLKHARADSISSPFGPDEAPFDLRSDRRAAVRRFLRRLKQQPWDRALETVDRLQEQTGVTPDEYLDGRLIMNWEEAREMARAGMELGGHTRTHPILGRVLDPAVVRAEVGGCFEDLVTHLGTRPRSFAYPVGSEGAMSPVADAEIDRAGFACSFSHLNGFAPRRPRAPVRIPRLHLSYGADHASFRLGMAASPARAA